MTEAEKIQMEIKQKEAEVLGLKKKLEEEQKRECEMYKRWTPKRGEIYYYNDGEKPTPLGVGWIAYDNAIKCV